MSSPLRHVSAEASHYDQEAPHYDAFNEVRSKVMNQHVEACLARHGVASVLDFTCGTGSQVFWLARRGFDVVGVDLSPTMLKLARQKLVERVDNVHVRLVEGDMRRSQLGQFDAVITMFNAIGHLTRSDYQQALCNIHANLKPGGVYVADIFNRSYWERGNNITQMTIDWQTRSQGATVREIQYSTLSPDGVLTSYDVYHHQTDDGAPPSITTACQTLQIYHADELQDALSTAGFEVVSVTGVDGAPFEPDTTERMTVVARRSH